jgi:diaminopimelate decarboxylase
MNEHDTVQSAPHWFDPASASDLISKYGSPLYLYHEDTMRLRLRELAGLLAHRPWHPSISVKANGNPLLLAIARSEGLRGDAMSPGEILLLEAAGFLPGEIFFIPNNVGLEELRFAARRGILTSLDSLDQVRLFARERVSPRVALRVNPGTGDGHHEKVVTAGGRTKFGLLPEELPEAIDILTGHDVSLVGLNQHIGSGFLEPSRYLDAARFLLELAHGLPQLEFVDFGGGFGIPYREGEPRLDLKSLGLELDAMLSRWCLATGRSIEARIEPGRYWCGESGCVIGTVHAVKRRAEGVIAGTDIGFNALQRPVLYDAWHRIDLLPTDVISTRLTETVTWVGNICESGDILGSDRSGPCPVSGDHVLVRDTGAYGWSMSSSYNARPRLPELLLQDDRTVRLIRRRETNEDLMRGIPA